MRRLAVFVVFVFQPLLCLAQGLGFYGHDCQIDRRSSFEIRSPLSSSAHRRLEISFDFKTLPGASDGYILRMKSARKDDSPIVNLFYEETQSSYLFQLILEGKRFLLQLEVPKKSITLSQTWTRVCLSFDILENEATLSVGDVWSASGPVELPRSVRPHLWFGKSEYLIDVPSFAIRALDINGDGESVSFAFSEDSGDIALSSKWYIRGRATNPVWLLDGSYHFRRVSYVHSDHMLCAGFDAERHRVYMFNRDSLAFLDMVSEHLDTYPTANACPVINACATSFINPTDGTIYAYEVYYDDESNRGKPTVARLDTETREWTVLSNASLDMQMHHHSQWFDEKNLRFTIFGGYGNRRYNGSFYTYDLTAMAWSKWSVTGGDTISPRFFSSMGYDSRSGNLLIFGGMGNESGDQIVGREYFYDLFEVNPITGQSRRLWSIDWDEANCVAVRGMVVDGDYFYTLCYPEYETISELKLYKFSIATGEFEVLADSIPINSDKITTNANLYYDREQGQMIVVVEESSDDISSSVSTYIVSYPPDSQHVSTVVSRMRQKIAVFACLLLLSFTGLVVYLMLSRARRRKSVAAKLPPFIKSNTDQPNSIYLFGTLTVINRDGVDITSRFTAKLRQMFLLILKYSSDGGVHTKKISGILWPDKEEAKAKNLRGVTANNLRKFLSELDGISLVYDDGKFSFRCDYPFYCDYLDFIGILDSDSPNVDSLLSIVSRGKFLKNESDPLFDNMRGDVERSVKSLVTVELSRRFSLKQYENTILCADILFSLDPLDDDALRYSIRSLIALGDEAKAGVTYQTFITKYKKDYGEDYPMSFDEM